MGYENHDQFALRLSEEAIDHIKNSGMTRIVFFETKLNEIIEKGSLPFVASVKAFKAIKGKKSANVRIDKDIISNFEKLSPGMEITKLLTLTAQYYVQQERES